MEHARSVLHLFTSCVALENKLQTVNETRNREQWRHAFYDKTSCQSFEESCRFSSLRRNTPTQS